MPAGRQGKAKKNSLKIGIIFSAVIICLLAFSLLGKLFFIIGQSKYDDGYPLSIKVESSRQQLLEISPREGKISLLNLNIESSVLELPVEAQVTIAKPIDQKDISSFFLSLMKDRAAKTNLTSIDLVRLYLFAKTVAQSDINSQTISNTVGPATDKIVASLFKDPRIASEGLRVEVVNATGVYGVGNRVAKLLTNLGANIVFVSTADNTEKNSVLYYMGSKTYTVQRFERVLGIKAVLSKEKSISDIMVRVGENSVFINQ